MEEDGRQSSVVFHAVSIKKNSAYGDDVHAAFTCNNYQPSGDDFVGVFNTESDSCHDVPFVYKTISSLLPEVHSTTATTVSLKLDFVMEGCVFELRFVTADKLVCFCNFFCLYLHLLNCLIVVLFFFYLVSANNMSTTKFLMNSQS